jgi:hypothetical protein
VARVVHARSTFRQRRRRRLLLIAAAVIFFVLVVCTLCVLFFNAPFLRITAVSATGGEVVPSSSIEEVVKHDIAGKYAYLFAKNNIFIYPKKGIEGHLLELFPTLKTAGVHAKDFHTIAVTVVERTPVALWCGATQGADGTCLLLDENGLAYANAPQYGGAVYRTYFGALPAGPLPKQYLTPDEFRTLAALATAFEKKVAPDTLSAVAVDENSDVRLRFAGGYDILVALHDDTGQIFDRFSLALTSAPFASHTLADFEYVDMRFGDKVYYKLKTK